MTTERSGMSLESDDVVDAVTKAMRRAWQLGQTYWQQADSESWSQNKKSDETQAKFLALVDETRADLSSFAARHAAVPDAIVAGALLDFLGFLTSRDEPVTLSASHFAGTAVEVLREWNEKRGLRLDEADVTGWTQAMLAQRDGGNHG